MKPAALFLLLPVLAVATPEHPMITAAPLLEDRAAPPERCGGPADIPCSRKGFICVDDPSDKCFNKDKCPGVCVKDRNFKQCGGFAGFTCPKGFSCVDDPRDDCDPANGGADCSGICIKTPRKCQHVTLCVDYINDCGQWYGGCYDTCTPTTFTPPPCSTTFNPNPSYTPKPPPRRCGGLQGLPCGKGQYCIDDPSDYCNPARGGSDCIGVCVSQRPPKSCGGFTVEPHYCLKNETCVFGPDGGATDKPGICAVRARK